MIHKSVFKSQILNGRKRRGWFWRHKSIENKCLLKSIEHNLLWPSYLILLCRIYSIFTPIASQLNQEQEWRKIVNLSLKFDIFFILIQWARRFQGLSSLLFREGGSENGLRWKRLIRKKFNGSTMAMTTTRIHNEKCNIIKFISVYIRNRPV